MRKDSKTNTTNTNSSIDLGYIPASFSLSSFEEAYNNAVNEFVDCRGRSPLTDGYFMYPDSFGGADPTHQLWLDVERQAVGYRQAAEGALAEAQKKAAYLGKKLAEGDGLEEPWLETEHNEACRLAEEAEKKLDEVIRLTSREPKDY